MRWSARAADQVCVALEQMIVRGKIAAAEAGQRPVALQPLAELLADLNGDFDRPLDVE
ncbi:MAG TPA: hypothetical protein VGH56_00600 [Solirubrobacteraceae bacterium]